MNIHIHFSYGRLGNFFIQIRNALHIAISLDYNIILPEHEYFNTNYIIINPSIDINAERVTDCHQYYYRNKCLIATPDMFKCNNDRVLTIMKDIFL